MTVSDVTSAIDYTRLASAGVTSTSQEAGVYAREVVNGSHGRHLRRWHDVVPRGR